jgi:hypothetical protein
MNFQELMQRMVDLDQPMTEEPNEVVCPKDVRDGKTTDRFLAPAISRFATTTIAGAFLT